MVAIITPTVIKSIKTDQNISFIMPTNLPKNQRECVVPLRSVWKGEEVLGDKG